MWNLKYVDLLLAVIMIVKVALLLFMILYYKGALSIFRSNSKDMITEVPCSSLCVEPFLKGVMMSKFSLNCKHNMCFLIYMSMIQLGRNDIGVILGTATNAVYVEQANSIPKWNGSPPKSGVLASSYFSYQIL